MRGGCGMEKSSGLKSKNLIPIEFLNPNRMGRKGKTTLDRFLEKIDFKDGDECWEWEGSKAIRYGRFSISPYKVVSHRYMYFLFTGYYPKPYEYVCHHCDNIYCVNPYHLFLGNQFDNMKDMVSKGRNFDTKGVNNGRCKLTEDEVLEIRKLRDDGFTYKSLCNMFSMGQTQIARIVRRESWAWLDGSG